jgi:uncharacterized membrane protein YbaN (DUF454 family)
LRVAESPKGRRRLPYVILAYVCIGLAAAGVVLPLLPTVPFLIVAAWAASRGSPRLDRWLHEHPRFGPSLRAWRDEGAVPMRAKVLSCSLLAMSWIFVLLVTSSPWAPLATGILFVCVALYVCTRPAPRDERGVIR